MQLDILNQMFMSSWKWIVSIQVFSRTCSWSWAVATTGSYAEKNIKLIVEKMRNTPGKDIFNMSRSRNVHGLDIVSVKTCWTVVAQDCSEAVVPELELELKYYIFKIYNQILMIILHEKTDLSWSLSWWLWLRHWLSLRLTARCWCLLGKQRMNE